MEDLLNECEKNETREKLEQHLYKVTLQEYDTPQARKMYELIKEKTDQLEKRTKRRELLAMKKKNTLSVQVIERSIKKQDHINTDEVDTCMDQFMKEEHEKLNAENYETVPATAKNSTRTSQKSKCHGFSDQ